MRELKRMTMERRMWRFKLHLDEQRGGVADHLLQLDGLGMRRRIVFGSQR